jgi:NitT/TauT family transport system substrate-binding protein
MRLTAFVLALATGAALAASPAHAQVEKPAVKLTLGWLFQAPQAPYVYAAEKGYFKAEGMEVAIDRGAGSGASIQRVISGSHEIGHADMGVIIKWNAENPEKQLLVFYVPEDGYPLAIISLKDRANITTPKQLEGKKLGAPVFDGARQMFPSLAKANGVDASKVAWVTMDAPLREPMLVRGEVDAIAGFITSGGLGVEGLGVKRENIVVMKYDDHKLDGYGNVVFAMKEFVEKNPRTITALTKAINRAYRDTVADPRATVNALKGRDPLVNMDLENKRMVLAVKEMYLTPNVKANGMSFVEPKKLEKTIASTLDAFNVKGVLKPEQVYTDRFLPPRAERMMPEFRE